MKNWLSLRVVLIGLALLALYGTGLGLRRTVIDTQRAVLGADVPFTLESALRFRRAKMVYDTGRMPAIDSFVQYPEGVVVRETYEFGSECLQAGLARLLPKAMPIAERFRWVEAGWFCLGIPFMALWIAAWTGRWSAGFTAAAFYAVAFSAITRSTGLELSNENYALPLLIAHLAFDALAAAEHARTKRLAYAAISAFMLAWSLWWWDLIQFYVLLWGACALKRELSRREPLAEDELLRFVLQAAALFYVGAVSPYHRAHAFLGSPAMSVVSATVLVLILGALNRAPSATKMGAWLARLSTADYAALLTVAVLLPFATSSLLHAAGHYQANYDHFGELLYAKLRYLNHKPADPSLLTFDQRIMWVPALNSADVQLTRSLFPGILPLSFVAVSLVFPLVRKRSIPRLAQLVVYYTISLITFWFFVRFQVFVAVFSAAVLGVWVGMAGTGWLAWTGRGLLLLGFMVETANAVDGVRRPERSGRPNVYYKELAELAGWLTEHASPEPVLANFGVSGSIAAYGKCPIVLHPKFESGALRERVREYADLLFKGTERSFRDWADSHGARYYVYAMGEFAKESPELQLRYMADAMDPPEDAPARLFESNPAKLTYFRRVWGNRKYGVYEMFGLAQEREATGHAAAAENALESGDVKAARAEAEAALRIDPGQERAQRVLEHVMALEMKGYSNRVDDEPAKE